VEDFQFSGTLVVAIGRQTADGINLFGTGFGITKNLIATAAHVVGHTEQGLVAVLPPQGSPDGYQDTTSTKVMNAKVTIAAFDPVRDIAILKLAPLTINVDTQLGMAISLTVVAHGYPHTDTGRLVLTQHAAMVGARVLLGASGLQTKHIVLNIQTKPGQSGSPVFSGGGVCAMIVGAYRPAGGSGIFLGNIDPATLHQTTHAVSAEYIKEMV
jgi:V8-like Glu-specific endopeptidase